MELAILIILCIVIYIWMEQCVWMELAYVWTMCMDETDVICDMKLMCWICDMEIYLYMSYIFAVKIVGLKKQKKETICRLFAVCHRWQRALCHQQRTAKRPRGRQLCFLGGWPIWSVCLQWLTTKACHVVTSANIIRRTAKAFRSFRQRPAVNHLTE